MDLLLLVKHHVGGEDLAGQQQTCQGCQACHLQGTAVGSSERVKEMYASLEEHKAVRGGYMGEKNITTPSQV